MAASASAGSSERAGFRSGGDFGQSPWLLLDAAQVVFESAKSRVYKKGSYTVATTASSNATTTGGGGIAPAPPRQLRAGTFPGVPPNFIPILEEQPKWSVLVNILREIQADRLQQLKDFKGD